MLSLLALRSPKDLKKAKQKKTIFFMNWREILFFKANIFYGYGRVVGLSVRFISYCLFKHILIFKNDKRFSASIRYTLESIATLYLLS